MQLLFATSNAHKIGEVRAILAPLGIDVIGLDALETTPDEPEEDGDTFAQNACLKAVGYAKATQRLCLADDSGIEVDALNGAPGVYSARWAGVEGTRRERDEANNQLLLQELHRIPRDQRTARFVCAMCLAAPSGDILAQTRGEFQGIIADEPRGSNGFGYDPLLYVEDAGCTSAEMSPQEKNRWSHRGKAARAMADEIRALGIAGR